jgi:hypothetical protein
VDLQALCILQEVSGLSYFRAGNCNTDNTKKVGITPEQAAIVDNTSGSNTGDQDLSGLAEFWLIK